MFKALKEIIKTKLSFSLRISSLVGTYFLFKFGLYFMNLSGFDFALNLVLFLLCLFSIRVKPLNKIYKTILIIFGLVLIYHDSYLPMLSPQVVYDEKGIAGVFELLSTFVSDYFDFSYLGIFVLLFIAVFFINDFLKVTTIVVICFITVACLNISALSVAKESKSQSVENVVADSADIPPQIGTADSQGVENYLQTFLELERQRIVTMPSTLPENFTPFDIVIVNICSMATDDIEASNLLKHPLFRTFDFSFDTFNSVSSYSTPSSLRLLRSNCGQMTEAQMYKERRSECELITSVEQLGYQSEVYFDHNGKYGDYLKTLHDLGGLNENIHDLSKLAVKYNAFDGSAIRSDSDLFKAYVNNIARNGNVNNITFMNLLSLHDGNRLAGEKKSQSYAPRLKLLLDNLEDFIKDIRDSNRNTLFIMVPEHGAAIRGDKMQIAKLREIPTDKITRIPVGVSFLGAQRNAVGGGTAKAHKTQRIKGFYSYLAISEIVKRSIEDNVFAKNEEDSKTDKIADVFYDLPQTAFIAESTNAYYMNFQHQDFYKLKGEHWEKYIK